MNDYSVDIMSRAARVLLPIIAIIAMASVLTMASSAVHMAERMLRHVEHVTVIR